MNDTRPAAHSGVRLVGWTLIMAAIPSVALGCRETSEHAPSPTLPTAPVRAERGMRVVVERTAGEFLEATVLEAKGEQLRLQTADGSQTLRVLHTDVYLLSDPRLESSPGEYAICDIGGHHWRACQLTALDGRERVVLTSDAREHRLNQQQVLAVTALTRMNIEHLFQRMHQRRQFLEDLAKAGTARPPEGWRPSPRERVVARRGDDWYTGRVHELEEDGVRVQWRSDSSVEKVAKDHIVPEPPYPLELKRGDFAMLRPKAQADPWTYVRVRAVNDGYKVEDAQGTVTMAEKTQLIPLSLEGLEQ